LVAIGIVDFVVGLHGVEAKGGIASEFYITLAAGGAERHSFFVCSFERRSFAWFFIMA
jgi:hypothetical protein